MPWSAETAVWCDARGLSCSKAGACTGPRVPSKHEFPECVLGMEPARRLAQAANIGAGGGQRGPLFRDSGREGLGREC